MFRSIGMMGQLPGQDLKNAGAGVERSENLADFRAVLEPLVCLLRLVEHPKQYLDD
jgi:hypothetical protein